MVMMMMTMIHGDDGHDDDGLMCFSVNLVADDNQSQHENEIYKWKRSLRNLSNAMLQRCCRNSGDLIKVQNNQRKKKNYNKMKQQKLYRESGRNM